MAPLERPVETGGRYLVAVYDQDGRPGQVGVVAGDRETFTVGQYVTVAWNLYRIYLWVGDHPLVVFEPSLVVLVGGLVAVRRHLGHPGAAGLRYVLATSGLLCVAMGANVLLQTVQATLATGPSAAVVVPIVYVRLPVMLGGAAVTRAVDSDLAFEPRDRALLAVAGLVSLGTWARFVVAPLALLGFAVVPRSWTPNTPSRG